MAPLPRRRPPAMLRRVDQPGTGDVSDRTRVAIVTGIGRRGQAGEVVARVLAQRGSRISAVTRSPAEAEERAAELREGGFDALPFACDLTDEARVASLARDVAAASDGRVDALVNLAGGFGMSGPVAGSDSAVWRTQFAINLTTAYLATRAFLPMVRAARGAIVYVASAAALPGARTARMSAYVAAKSGVIALMHAVAEEERDNDVRANAVAPTMIRTATNVESMGAEMRYVEREQVAAAVAWLCSDDARAVTGQVVRLG